MLLTKVSTKQSVTKELNLPCQRRWQPNCCICIRIILYELHDANREARLNVVNWYLHVLHEAISPTNVLCSEEVWVYVSGYVTLTVAVMAYKKSPINI